MKSQQLANMLIAKYGDVGDVGQLAHLLSTGQLEIDTDPVMLLITKIIRGFRRYKEGNGSIVDLETRLVELATLLEQPNDDAKWLHAIGNSIKSMLAGPGLTTTHVARFTVRYTRYEIESFIRGDFGNHDPLEALTHLAVVISENLR